MTLKGVPEMTRADVKRAAERIALRVETIDGKDYLVDSTGKRTPIDNIDVIEGPPGKAGQDGKDGIVPMYGADGTLWQGVIDVEFETVTDSNGRWQVDYSSFGFTATPRVRPIAWLESISPADQAITGGASKSKTQASGRVVRGVSGSLLGVTSTWRFVPAGTPVTVTVTGPTK